MRAAFLFDLYVFFHFDTPQYLGIFICPKIKMPHKSLVVKYLNFYSFENGKSFYVSIKIITKQTRKDL